MNKNKEKQRVANGKPAKLTDRSMNLKYVAGVDDGTGSNAFLDLTDKENDEVRRIARAGFNRDVWADFVSVFVLHTPVYLRVLNHNLSTTRLGVCKTEYNVLQWNPKWSSQGRMCSKRNV